MQHFNQPSYNQKYQHNFPLSHLERNPEAIQTSVDGFIYPDWIAGIFLLMPKKIFEGLEGFDERYTLYFEDVEFCIRAGLEGLK